MTRVFRCVLSQVTYVSNEIWKQDKCWTTVPFLASFPGSPAPDMQTLKLYRRRDLGMFSHVSSVKAREALIVRGHTRRLRTPKERRHWATYHTYVYLANGGKISYTPSVEGIVGWTKHKMLPYWSVNSGPISIASWSHEKRYQVLPMYTYLRARVARERGYLILPTHGKPTLFTECCLFLTYRWSEALSCLWSVKNNFLWWHSSSVCYFGVFSMLRSELH